MPALGLNLNADLIPPPTQRPEAVLAIPFADLRGSPNVPCVSLVVCGPFLGRPLHPHHNDLCVSPPASLSLPASTRPQVSFSGISSKCPFPPKLCQEEASRIPRKANVGPRRPPVGCGLSRASGKHRIPRGGRLCSSLTRPFHRCCCRFRAPFPGGRKSSAERLQEWVTPLEFFTIISLSTSL